MIVGVSGFISSGKDTIAAYLVEHYGFCRISMASTLKDAVAAIFGWSREQLDGVTDESRLWREQDDQWWSAQLGRSVSPRWVLQYLATDVMRNHFSEDIWVASIEKRILQQDRNVVISDVRFPNEVSMVKRLGGILLRVHRGSNPQWFEHAMEYLNHMRSDPPPAHASEWQLLTTAFDYHVLNNSGFDELYDQIDAIMASNGISKNQDAGQN